MSAQPSAAYRRAVELLSDGEWHDYTEIVRKVAIVIPPGLAMRRSETDRIAAARQSIFSSRRMVVDSFCVTVHSSGGTSDYSADSFWARVDRSDPAGCWPFTEGGEITASGHVRLWWNGNKLYAHRIAYALSKGPIVVGVIRHTCDVPPCCRPDHLRDGDCQANVRDRDERNRRTPFLPHGANHWSAKLSDDAVRELRSLRGTGASAAQLAIRFGVSTSTVHNVWREKHYPPVPVTL
jgi:hypothetical protein